MSMDNGRLTQNDDFDMGLRLGLETALGQTGFNQPNDSLADRNHFEVFGWPRGDLDGWDEENWVALYLRNAYAKVVNDKPVATTWRDTPNLSPRNGDSDSPFSELIEQLDRNQRLWSYAERVDRAAGLGQHALLLIDTRQRQDQEDWATDARDEDIDGLDSITGYRPILDIQIDEIDYGGPDSERWGKPEFYQIDLSDDIDEETQDDPLGSMRVHWTRAVNVPATKLLDDEILARPRAEPVLNNLLDIEKTLGAAAEAAYRAADYGLHINADPTQVDFDDGASELAEELQRYEQDLQRYIRTQGTEINRLGGDIQDPSGIVENNLDAISAETGIPKKELRGNESGEVSGAEQDKLSYFGTIQERRQSYANPHIVRGIIDRHILLGVFDRPDGGYVIEWPDLHELSESDRADIQNKRAGVIANVPGLVGTEALEYLKDGAEAIAVEDSPAPMPQVDEGNPDVQAQFAAANGLQANQDGPALDDSIELKDSVVSAAEAAFENEDSIPSECGTGRGTQRRDQIRNGNVTVRDLLTRDNGTPIPAYANSHAGDFSDGAEDTPISEWTAEMWSQCGNAGLARWGVQSEADIQWWKEQANEAARKRDEELPYPELTDNATRFSEGDAVKTPQGFGVVVEVRTDSFTGKNDAEIDASENSPTYVVGLQDGRIGVGFYSASELTATEFPETDIENPLDDVSSEQTSNSLSSNGWTMPDTWRESEKPARLILLDAWSSMGGQFDCGGACCMGELKDAELCASMKDEALGGWTGWRNSGNTANQDGDTGNGKPFSTVPVLPDNLQNLTKAWLIRWAEWVAAGRPEITQNSLLSENFNPALHPRDPETGKFVERPFNVPDDIPDFGSDSPAEILQFLSDEGEDIDAILDPESGVTIDGVPNDATSIEEIPDDPDEANPDIETTEIEWVDDIDGRTSELEDALRKTVQFGEQEGVDTSKPVPLPDDEEQREEWLERVPPNVANALARSKDPEVAVQTIENFERLGNDGEGSHGSNNWSSGGSDSHRMKLTATYEAVAAHETGHAMHKTYGATGNVGTSAIDYNGEIPDYDWDNPEDTIQTYTLNDPNRSISKSDMENLAFGSNEWRGRVDSEVGEELTDRNFTTPGDNWMREGLSEGSMVQFAEYPTQKFDEDGPTKWTVVERDGVDVTLEGPQGETFEAEVNPRQFGPDTLDSADIHETNGFVPDVIGKRENTPENWGLTNPNPDEIIGELDRPDSVEGRMHEINKEANSAWYKQHRINNVYGEGTAEESHIKTAYSSTTAHEVLAQTHEVMSGDVSNTEAEQAAHSLVNHHPRLLERYRQQFEITGVMKEKINTELKIQGADVQV